MFLCAPWTVLGVHFDVVEKYFYVFFLPISFFKPQTVHRELRTANRVQERRAAEGRPRTSMAWYISTLLSKLTSREKKKNVKYRSPFNIKT